MVYFQIFRSMPITQKCLNTFIQFLTPVNLSTEIWYPTDIIALPQRSNQFAVGLSWSITKDILVTNEVYYKWINRIVNSRDGVRLMMMIKVEKSFLEMEQVMVMNSIKKKMENLLDG